MKPSEFLIQRSISIELFDSQPSDTDEDRVLLPELRSLCCRELTTLDSAAHSTRTPGPLSSPFPASEAPTTPDDLRSTSTTLCFGRWFVPAGSMWSAGRACWRPTR